LTTDRVKVVDNAAAARKNDRARLKDPATVTTL